jgi:hypothetical protein
MAELITPENPAVTVASVTNPDLREAFLEAHELYMANPGLKGIILHRPDEERLAARPADFDWMQDRMRLLEMEQYSYQEDQIRGHKAEFLATPDYEANEGTGAALERFGITFGGPRVTVEYQNIDATRRDRIDQLTELFGYVRGSIHFETSNAFRPHRDGSGVLARDYYDDERLFSGRRVRYLESRNGPGTLILDTPDSYETETVFSSTRVTSGDPAKARQMREGDILLFFDDMWGDERSLPHSSPDFQIRNGDYRMLDNFDLGAGRRVADLRVGMP